MEQTSWPEEGRPRPFPWEEWVAEFEERIEVKLEAAARACGRRLRPGERDDLRQEVYCRLLGVEAVLGRLREADDGPAATLAYLERVARSVVVDWIRGDAALKRGRERTVAGDALVADVWVDPAPDPEQRLLATDADRSLRRRLALALRGSGAPDRNLRIVELAVFEGLSGADVARRLGGVLTESAVYTFLHRWRRRFRELGPAAVLG